MSTILLIEDDEFIQHLLALRLHNQNFTVLVAEDGFSGIETAVTYQPDLILMDIRLPHMNGWEATRKLRALPETAHIPIIALTSQTLNADKQKCIDAGCNAYIEKPINFRSLFSQIGALTA